MFSSFKMLLGIDMGPDYPQTALRKDKHNITIENARDATREFFRLLYQGIEKSLNQLGLPKDLCVSVTVPASFEANQRRDLIDCLADAGLQVQNNSLIDEPNAAFLSFLHTSARDKTESDLSELVRSKKTRVLVYDFGAGTCDVSILEFRVVKGKILSRNLAISRFLALGGNDFDRAIAEKVLLPQLLESAPEFELTQREISEQAIPHLLPTAERLKIAALEWAENHDIRTLQEMRNRSEKAPQFSDNPVPVLSIRKNPMNLDNPCLTLEKLAEAMEPLVTDEPSKMSSSHVLAPINDALTKSRIEPGDLDALLFIGGSALNPAVRSVVKGYFPDTVRSIVPKDLRSHVSVGAALHCLALHAFGHDMIRPVTSDIIYVITRGEKLETVFPAATPVPTERDAAVRLQVDREGQKVVELPICVFSKNKLLGNLKVKSPSPFGFRRGSEVYISAKLTRDKLLKIKAEIAGAEAEVSLMNPLANSEVSLNEKYMLEARQALNLELLENRHRPSFATVLTLAEAAYRAEAYIIAAEMFEAAERLDPECDFATNIACSYSQMGRRDLAEKWFRIAYDREQTACTCYNRSLYCDEDEQEKFLNEALEYDPEYSPALYYLGKILRDRGDPNGIKLIEKCVRTLEAELNSNSISASDCTTLENAANAIGKAKVAKRASERRKSLTGNRKLAFSEENLAKTIGGQMIVAER